MSIGVELGSPQAPCRYTVETGWGFNYALFLLLLAPDLLQKKYMTVAHAGFNNSRRCVARRALNLSRCRHKSIFGVNYLNN
jgi:hypothetical protein